MPLDLTVDLPIPELQRLFTDLERKQLPFATALALTRTVQDAQTDLRDELPQRFTIRNTFLEKGIRIERATKRSLQAKVFTVDEILLLQIEGGSKGGRGHSVALARGRKANAKGVVTKANRPRALRTKAKHFVAPVRGGGRGLFKRPTKKRYPIELLWRLHDGTVRVDSSFDFDAIAARSFRRNFPRRFSESVKRALASAK